MATAIGEAAVGKVCEITVQMFVQKLAEEAKLLVNFRNDFKWLNKKLKHLRGFLIAADRQSRHNEDMEEWLEEIHIICMLAEDIFDECTVESIYRKDAHSWSGLISWKKLIYRWRMGRRIKDIKDRIRSVIEDADQLNLSHQALHTTEEALPSTSQSAEQKRSNLLPSDSYPVGIQSKVDDILGLLENNAFPVIAVVGMGGMGNTYILQHLYNTIRERYEISVWLSVCQFYSVSNLQKKVIFHIDENLSERIKDSEVYEEVLAPMIHERLQGKRCLVVLDDVWRAEREYDLLARLGLPTGNNSPCKIVITTRSREVCTNLNAQIYEMQYLSDEDSRKLFCVYAFEDRQPPKHLEEVGHNIVKQCGNLPLAIRTIGASLAKTRMPSEWESKLHQLQEVVAADVDRIMPILRLSYDSLSARLKSCFAYLSFFPEDEKIEFEYLVKLWIGEGFIPAGEGQLDVARDCLYQLENLCLIQVWWEETEILELQPLVQYCRVHDLLLDLAIQVSRDIRCGFSLDEVSQNSNGEWCRILLGKKGINDDAISEMHPRCLRTFSLSQNEGIRSISTDLFTAMRGLRVLDLSETSITELPESIGKMKLLKVLNLRGTYIREVPEYVRHLKSLSFLALPGPRCKRLPEWINEVKCLQYIECEGVRRMPRGVSQLVSLRTLRSDMLHLSLNDDGFMKLEDLASMTQLQELWLNVNHEMVKDEILPQLVNMRHLLIRNLLSNGEDAPSSNLELSQKMTAMQQLESLLLWNFAVPSWICALVNLRDLQLNYCEFSEIPQLQIMPNLVRLHMIRNSRCRIFPEGFGKAGGFPCLKFLTISNFYELEEFPELEEGAMAFLEKFYLVNCSKVKKVGAGLERLKRLKRFRYLGSGTEQVKDAFKEGGEYWHRIKAINPHVTITDRL